MRTLLSALDDRVSPVFLGNLCSPFLVDEFEDHDRKEESGNIGRENEVVFCNDRPDKPCNVGRNDYPPLED